MNFVFFSVHFPGYMKDFSRQLAELGVNVLGIGDTDENNLDNELRASLTDYYKVINLENYDEVLRATGFFTHKYGKIDRFESLNEHWLELEARIRADFNIEGMKPDQVERVRRKSMMKKYFEKSGVVAIPCIHQATRQDTQQFAKMHGYPIIVKPDKGSGASMTYRINGYRELEQFFGSVPAGVSFIAEKFIDGTIITYDGLTDRSGNVLFESSTIYEQSIMEVVNNDDHVHYITLPEVPADVRDAGSRIIRAFGAKERFFHLELFRTRDKHDIVALEINMRPPGAWMTDAINFTHDMDIYREWARMVTLGRVGGPFRGKYFTAYASRKDHKNYRIDHQAILRQMNGNLVRHSPIEPVFSRAMGNYAYQFRTDTMEEARHMIRMIQETI